MAQAEEWDTNKPVNVDEVALRDSAFLAAHYVGFAGSDKGVSRTLFEVSLLNDYFRQNPYASWAAASTYLESFRPFMNSPAVNAGLPLDSYMESVAKVAKEASTDPIAKAAIVAIGEIYKQFWNQNLADEERLAREGEALDSIRTKLNDGQQGVQHLDRVKEILSTARSLSESEQTGGAFARAYDHSIGSRMGISIDDSADELFTKVPVLKTLRGIEELKDGQGGIRTTLGKIETLFRGELTKLHQEIEGIDGKLVGIEDRLTKLETGQQVLLDYVRDETGRRIKAEQERQLAAKAQERIDASNAAIFIFSTLVSGIDPKVGLSIQALGTAAVQIATSLNKWAEATASLGATETLTSLSTVIMTGNVMGAVMALMPLLVDSGPSPDELILQGIGELRDQVADLHRQMDRRFDHVDRSLNLIYAKLRAGLDDIGLATGRIEGGVKALHDDLITLRTDLHRVESGLFNVIRDQEQRSLLLRADSALGLRARSLGSATMSQDAYLDHESFFWTWTHDFPFDRIAIGPLPAERSYLDRDVLRELRGHPLEANVGYLSELARRWAAAPFASRPGSYRQWALGANAYAQLAMEWPQHARQIAPGRLESLYQVGKDLRADLRRIANVGTTEAPLANELLFSRARDNYTIKARELRLALEVVEAQWRAGPGLQLDPFAGRDQIVARHLLQPPPGDAGEAWPGKELCGPLVAEMLSETSARTMLPPPLLVAKRLELGDTRICLRDVRWVDWQTKTWPKTEIDSAKLAFEVASQYQDGGSQAWEDVIVRTGRGERQDVCSSDTWSQDPPPPDCLDADMRFESDWPSGLRETFEQNGIQVTENGALLQRVGTAVDANLVALQRALYTVLRDSFDSGPVHNAAIALSGAHAAMADLVALGLPRALMGDELLRSLLQGDQRLLDHELTRDLYVAVLSPNSPPAWSWLDTAPYLRSPGKNILTAMNAVGEERVTALWKRLQLALQAVDRGQPQPHPLLEGALAQLAAAQNLVAASVPRPPRPPAPQDPPTVTGAAGVGETVTATRGSWTGGPGPFEFTYQWLQCEPFWTGEVCTAIPGAENPTFDLTAQHEGKQLRVRVHAVSAAGAASETSEATETVRYILLNTAIPEISGDPAVGGLLNSTPGRWSGWVTTLDHQWMRCERDGRCERIGGATSADYELTEDDFGKRIHLTVTASNPYTTTSVTSRSILVKYE